MCRKKTVLLARIFLVCVACNFMFLQQAAADEISYDGSSQCEGMQVNVSFNLDTRLHVVKNFKASHSCIEGTGGSSWEPEGTIQVKEDNSFYFADSWGNFVDGKIGPDNNASGTLNKGAFSFNCKNDDNFFPPCTSWKASMGK